VACVRIRHILGWEAHGQCTGFWEPNLDDRATPVAYADVEESVQPSLCMKSGIGLHTLTKRVRWQARPFLTRTRTLPESTRRRAGSYGSLETYLRVELGNSTTV
jgi:hypothetical protein